MAIQIVSYVIYADKTDAHKYVVQKYVASRVGTIAGESRFDSRADINGDGKIDIKDVAQFAKDPELTFKTFKVTPVPWQQAALTAIPLAFGLVGVAALVILRKH